MVTIYLADTSIRLESKMAVSEYALEKYKMFKEEMPKEFSISKTRRGCFAYLNQHYTGSDVVAQAANLDDENGKIVERLAKMKTEDELNLNSCMRVLKKYGHDLLADWVYKKLTTALEAQDEEVEKEPELSELETQDEQKPADKVEQKFKVGDWVVYDHKTYQIVELPQGRLINASLSRNGKTEQVPLPYCEKWSIQDAKNGDVLVSTWKGHSYIYIFKEIESNAIVSHIYYYPELDTISDGIVNMANTPTIPATKEQRDALEKAITDAGWKFDFEKKELKKIEKKSVECSEDNLPDFESYLCLMFQKFRTKGMCTNGEIIDYVNEHSQKLKDILCHAWSEEDERYINIAVSAFSSPSLERLYHYNKVKSNDLINWLKSLKDKVQSQPKQEK